MCKRIQKYIVIAVIAIIALPAIASAAIHFITKPDIKYQGTGDRPCFASGYTLTGVCSGNKTPFEYCPSDSNYYRTCRCDSSLYQFDTSNCSDGKILGGKICDGKYDTCGCSSEFVFDDTNCAKPKVLGGNTCDNKYTSCQCPNTYSVTCLAPMVGVDDKDCDGKYTGCKCPSEYVKCDYGGVGQACNDGSGNKYLSCKTETCEDRSYLSTIPVNQTCTNVTVDGNTCYTNCRALTCADGNYLASNPSNQVCETIAYGGRNCYGNCREKTCTELGYTDKTCIFTSTACPSDPTALKCKTDTCEYQIRKNNPTFSINGDKPGATVEVITKTVYQDYDFTEDNKFVGKSGYFYGTSYTGETQTETTLGLNNKFINSGKYYYEQDKTKYSYCSNSGGKIWITGRKPGVTTTIPPQYNIDLNTNEINMVNLSFSHGGKLGSTLTVHLKNNNIWNNLNVEVGSSDGMGGILNVVSGKTFTVDNVQMRSANVQVLANSTLIAKGNTFFDSYVYMAGKFHPYNIKVTRLALAGNGVVDMSKADGMLLDIYNSTTTYTYEGFKWASENTGTGGVILTTNSKITLRRGRADIYAQANNKYPLKVANGGRFETVQAFRQYGGTIAIGNGGSIVSDTTYHGGTHFYKDTVICMYPKSSLSISTAGKSASTQIEYRRQTSNPTCNDCANILVTDVVKNWSTSGSATYCGTAFPY